MELVVGRRFKLCHRQIRLWRKMGVSWSKPEAHYSFGTSAPVLHIGGSVLGGKYDSEAWDEFWFTMNGTINHTISVDANNIYFYVVVFDFSLYILNLLICSGKAFRSI
jgi:ABC-type transport system involved in cytochrome c biogenesis permease subunit